MTDRPPLPEFKVSVDTFETVVTLNGRFIGRAWQGSSTAWWVCRYQEDPKQFDDEATAKQHLVGVMKMPLPKWAMPARQKRGWEDLYGGPPEATPPKPKLGPCTECGTSDAACVASISERVAACCFTCARNNTHPAEPS